MFPTRAGMVVIAALAAASYCFAQAPAGTRPTMGSATVHVRVRTQSGDRVKSQAIVRLTAVNGTLQLTSGTQNNGEVTFSNLPLDGYRIQVTAPGYRQGQDEVAVPIPGRADVMIYLVPEDDPRAVSETPGEPVLAPKALEAVNKGMEAIQKQDYKEAEKHLDKAFQLAPGHPDVRYVRGVLYMYMQKPDRALPELEAAVQLDPKHARALATLGTVLYQMKERPAAIQRLEEALELSPDVWQSHWTLARAFYDERQFEKCLAHAEKAAELSEGKEPEIRLLLAQTLAPLEQLERAAQELELFLHENPKHPRAKQAQEWLRRVRERQAETRPPGNSR